MKHPDPLVTHLPSFQPLPNVGQLGPMGPWPGGAWRPRSPWRRVTVQRTPVTTPQPRIQAAAGGGGWRRGPQVNVGRERRGDCGVVYTPRNNLIRLLGLSGCQDPPSPPLKGFADPWACRRRLPSARRYHGGGDGRVGRDGVLLQQRHLPRRPAPGRRDVIPMRAFLHILVSLDCFFCMFGFFVLFNFFI